MDRQTEGDSIETIVSSGQVHEMCQKDNGVQKGATYHCSSKHEAHADRSRNSEAKVDNVQNGRPLSPRTRALMCDEEDAMFVEAVPANVLVDHSQNITQKSSNRHDCIEVYAEQEKVVLTRFRDFLNQLITRGSIKETMRSQLALGDKNIQREPAEYGAVKSGIPRRWRQNEPRLNGTVKSPNPIPETVEIGKTVSAASSASSIDMALKYELSPGKGGTENFEN